LTSPAFSGDYIETPKDWPKKSPYLPIPPKRQERKMCKIFEKGAKKLLSSKRTRGETSHKEAATKSHLMHF
jgi:hypothetical protein